MKKLALVFIAIAALILGAATAGMLSARSPDLLRLSESLVCPPGSAYRFSTRAVPFVDPQTGAEMTGTALAVDCVDEEIVLLEGVTRQAQGLFFWFAVAGWFAAFLLLWLLASLVGWLRPAPQAPPFQPITLSSADREKVLAYLQAGRKIEAVKHARQASGGSLAEAKAHVEQLAKEANL